MNTIKLTYAIAAVFFHLSIFAQQRTIETNETLVIHVQHELDHIGSFIVKGTLVINGSNHENNLLFSGNINVLDGGSAVLKKLTLKQATSYPNQSLLTFRASAKQVTIEDVLVLDNTSGAHEPAVRWEANYCSVKNLRVKTNRLALELRGDHNNFTNCLFESSADTLLSIAPAGLAVENRFESTTFKSEGKTNNSPGIAVLVQHPSQTFRHNTFSVKGHRIALKISTPNVYAQITTPSFNIEENSFKQINSNQGIGISLSSLRTKTPLNTQNNEIQNFNIGIETIDTRAIHQHTTLKNTSIGFSGNNISAINSTLINDASKNSYAIQLTGSNTKLYLDNITTENTTVFLRLDAPLKKQGQIGNIQMTNVGRILSIKENTSIGAGIAWKKGDPMLLKPITSPQPPTHCEDKVSNNHDQHSLPYGHNHNAHHTRKADVTHLYLPKEHQQVSDNCTSVAGLYGVKSCPIQSVGTLAIATGHGLSDPVVEHLDAFQSVDITKKERPCLITATSPQNVSSLLAANEEYQIDAKIEGKHQDLYVAWKSDDPIVLSLDQIADDKNISLPLGGILPEVATKEELLASTSSTYMNLGNTTKIKLVPTQGLAEVVLFNRTQALFDAASAVNVTPINTNEGLAFSVQGDHISMKLIVTDEMGEPLYTTHLEQAETVYVPETQLTNIEGGWFFVERNLQTAKGVWAR